MADLTVRLAAASDLSGTRLGRLFGTTLHVLRLPTWLFVTTSSAIAASTFEPALTVLAVVGAITAGALFLFPAAGYCVLVALFLIQLFPLYQDLGVISNTVTLSDGAALIVIAGYLSRLLLRREERPRLKRIYIVTLGLLATYFGWIVISSTWSPAALSDIVTAIRGSVEAIVLFLLAITLLNTRQRVQMAARAYAVVAVSLALWAIINYLLHAGSVGGASWLADQLYRGGVPTGVNQNELSVILALGPAFAFLGFKSYSVAVGTVVGVAAMVPVGVAMVILTSRGAFIDTAVGLVAAALFTQGYRSRAILGTLIALAALAIVLAIMSNSVPPYFTQRFDQISSDSFGHRQDAWSFGYSLFLSHPLVGVGAGGFDTLLPSANVLHDITARSAHSDYIGTLAETGLVGFVFLLAMLSVLGWIIVGQSGRDPACIFIMACLFSSMSADSFLRTHWIWIAFGIVYAYATCVKSLTDGGGHPIPNVLRLPETSRPETGRPWHSFAATAWHEDRVHG